MARQPSRRLLIQAFWAFAGVALILCGVWQHVIAADAEPSARVFVISQLVAGFVFLGAVYLALRRSETLSLGYVLLVGIVCRLVLLPSAPLFDDDIYRCLWDGKVLSHGVNPFLYPPSADELAQLRDPNWAKVGYAEIPTVYPPLAQLLFGLSYIAGVRSAVGLKSIFFLFDAANMLLIAVMLRQLRLPRCWTLVYAWSPLATKEFANSGHVEPVMLFFLLLAFHFWLRNGSKRTWAGIAFGAATVVKFVPTLLVPIAWKLGRWRSLAFAAAVVAALYLPFAGAGRRVFAGAGAYAQHWTFNDGAFALLCKAQSLVFPDAWNLAISPARVLAALAVGTFAVWAALKVKEGDRVGAVASSRNVLAVCLMLMPAVDPWYLCWLLPFMCVAPSVGLLLFTVTCSLSYLYYADNSFPVWIPLLEYVPVYLILLAEFLPKKRKRLSAAAASAGGTGSRN